MESNWNEYAQQEWREMMMGQLLYRYEKFVKDTITDKPRTQEAYLFWATDELAAEAGEVKGVLAKAIRKKGYVSAEDEEKLIDELGDVLWSLTATAAVLGVEIEEIMLKNMNKLQKREENGITYRGTGWRSDLQDNKDQESTA